MNDQLPLIRADLQNRITPARIALIQWHDDDLSRVKVQVAERRLWHEAFTPSAEPNLEPINGMYIDLAIDFDWDINNVSLAKVAQVIRQTMDREFQQRFPGV